jgi:hypothetical protein
LVVAVLVHLATAPTEPPQPPELQPRIGEILLLLLAVCRENRFLAVIRVLVAVVVLVDSDSVAETTNSPALTTRVPVA